jgi:hypothetical protein
VWRKAGGKGRACLRSVSLPELRKILAFSLWRSEVQKQETAISPASLREFVHDRCSDLFPLIQPPAPLKENGRGN